MQFRRKRRAAIDIGLIPMIDVLLVLLFFFMVATTFKMHTALKINLPEADGSEVEQQGRALHLFIDAQGHYAIADENGKSHDLINQDLATLKSALQQAAGNDRQQPFIINANGKTPHQAVVSALDVANQLGFGRITFAINTPEKR